MKNIIIFAILAFLSAVLFISCSEDEGVIQSVAVPAQLDSAAAPTKMALGSDYYHPFQAFMSGDMSGSQVQCYLLDTVGDTIADFYLHDDAGAVSIDDEKDYTSVYSGDVAAGDGIYVMSVNSGFTGTESEVQTKFVLTDQDSNISDSLLSNLSIYENQAPQITDPNLPLSLPGGFDAFNLETSVTDPQGYSDIAVVKFTLQVLGLDYFMIDPEQDGIFAYFMGPDFAAGKTSGSYLFSFAALDSLQAQSNIYYQSVFIENTPPMLSLPSLTSEYISSPVGGIDSLLTVPDPDDTLDIVVTVKVVDLQTLEDIQNVFINYERPTGVWTNDPPYPMADNGLEWDFVEYDNGNPYLGDETAGDGIFTFTKQYTKDVDPGIHRFHFQCIDKANQIADSVTVGLNIQP